MIARIQAPNVAFFLHLGWSRLGDHGRVPRATHQDMTIPLAGAAGPSSPPPATPGPWVSGLILAAGGSARMGRPKQLLPLGGRPLLQYVVDLAASELAETVLVLGASAAEIQTAVALPPGVRVVVEPRRGRGPGHLAPGGAGGDGAGVTGALVLLGDQPGVRSDAVRAVAAAPGADRAGLLRRPPGPPGAARPSVWSEVMALGGDAGARELIRRVPGLLVEVEVGGDPPPDVDTPEDYARLTAG